MLKRLLVFCTVGIVVTCAVGRQFQPVALGQEEVLVGQNPEGETDYRIDAKNCTITWSVSSSELNRGVIRQHSDCALPLDEQAPLIAKLLGKVLETREAGQF